MIFPGASHNPSQEHSFLPGRYGLRPTSKKAPWLVTFNDLITLLLTFFILIITMSTIHTEKLTAISDSLRQSFQMTEQGYQRPMFKTIVPDLVDDDIRLMRLQEELERARRQADLQSYLLKRFAGWLGYAKGMQITQQRDSVAVVFTDSMLFSPGSATLAKREPVLLELVEVIKEKGVRVTIEGHTDNVPIATATFPSNWELSVRRAINIGQFLITEGGIDARRLSAVGYADTRPVASNETAEGRQQNRRVSILLTSD